MREIRKSGSMSGEGKRSDARRAKPPRPSSTLLRAPDANFGLPTITGLWESRQCRPALDPRWSFERDGLLHLQRIEFLSPRVLGMKIGPSRGERQLTIREICNANYGQVLGSGRGG